MRTLSWSKSGKLNVVRISRSRPIAPDSTSSRAFAACGWWRHMNASITTTPARSAASQASSASAAVPRVRLLDEDVLAGLDRLQRPLVVHPVRERDVDGVELVVGEQLLVAAVGARDPVLGRVRLRLGAVAARDRGDLDAVRPAAEQRVG